MKIAIKGLAALTLMGALTIPNLAGAAPARALPTLFIGINGKTVSVSGTAVSGAVHLHLTVSNMPVGNMTLVHLRPGMTFQAAQKIVDPNDLNSIGLVGAIQASVGGPRGGSDFQLWLPAGQYVALDTSNQNAGPAQTPTTPFVVAQSSAPAQLPAPGATYKIIDFGFRGPSTIRNGEVLRIHNQGWLVHMAAAVAGKLRTYKAAEQIKSLIVAGKSRQAQRIAPVFADFSGPVSHGATVQSFVHAAPGWYVLSCFMDTQDHREHAQLGMARIIRVLP